jgi:anti-sigma factor RsiW
LSPAPCSGPLATELLVDYWLGELDAAGASRVERHLLGCDACAAAAQAIADLAAGIRAQVARGLLRGVVSEGFIERAAASGIQVRVYTVPRDGSVNCTIAPDDALLVARLAAPLDGLERVDLVMSDSLGQGIERAHDIPFDPAAGAVVLASRAVDVRALPAHRASMRLLGVDAAGERLLGEYRFNHTPWPGTPRS